MSKLKNLVIIPLCLGLITVSCKKDEDNPISEPECIEHFSYDESAEDAPSKWENYCVADGGINECGSVVRQSPINIVGGVEDLDLPFLTPIYNESYTDIVNNGHTIQFNYHGASSTLDFGGETYSLLQFHFHASSEHTLGGSHHPLEVHLVHANASGGLAVIGAFFELGTENEFLSEFTGSLPAHSGESYVDASLMYDATDLIPENNSYYNYNGSLTTPPCSEIVEWIVLEHPLEASQTQLDLFSGLLHGNYRPVQPLNGRTIKYRPSEG